MRETLTDAQIEALRAYLRQWIAVPAWRGRGIAELRAGIDSLTTRAAAEPTRRGTRSAILGISPNFDGEPA